MFLSWHRPKDLLSSNIFACIITRKVTFGNLGLGCVFFLLIKRKGSQNVLYHRNPLSLNLELSEMLFLRFTSMESHFNDSLLDETKHAKA